MSFVKLNTREVLGMNARNRLYTSKNSKAARQVANSKFLTKQLMSEHEIAVAKILGVLHNDDEVNNFAWEQLTGNFVLKPSNGSGGKGIVVFKKNTDSGQFRDTMGEIWTVNDIMNHCQDILEGKYSSHPGVGADISTGVTTYAITGGGRQITYLPDTKRKLAGILIPFWQDILLTAIRAANVAGITYAGVDIFIDKNRGPMVVELNTSPGLSIQLANHKGLKKRLERVRDLPVLNAEHGLKIGQALFRSSLAEKFVSPQEPTAINVVEECELHLGKKQRYRTSCFVNTKRSRSCISQSLAAELGLLDPEDLLWYQKTDTGEKQPVIAVIMTVGGKKLRTNMLVSRQLDRSKHKIHLGRRDLKGFVIKG